MLGAWLMGLHTEHIRKFDTADFTHERLFNALYRGRTAVDIAHSVAGYDMKVLTGLMEAYSESWYTQFYKKAYEEKIRRKAQTSILTNEGLRQIYDELGEVLKFGETPMPSKGFAKTIEDGIEYRRNEKCVKYGMPYLDRITGGIHKRDLTVVAARPGVGKSSFGLQVTAKCLQRKEKAVYFTLEMPTEQQLLRMLVQTQKTTQEALRNFEPLTDDAKKFLQTVENEGHLRFYDGVYKLEDICAVIRKEHPYMAVIDQLTQIKVARQYKNRLEELQDITSTLKRIALDEDVAVVLLCQINRDAANTEPTLANLKGSGQIEEDADNVILLHDLTKKSDAEGYPNKSEKEMLLKLEKHRNGETASYRIAFLADRFLFREPEKRY